MQTVDHAYTKQTEWKNEAVAESVKNTTKVTIAHGECKTTWAFANDKFATTAAAKAYADEDWKVDVNALLESKPAKEEWKVEGGAAISSPDFGGARTFFNVSATSQSAIFPFAELQTLHKRNEDTIIIRKVGRLLNAISKAVVPL